MPNNPATPQFGTAEYSSKPGAEICKSCKKEITGPYYRVNVMVACPDCVQKLKDQMPKDSHAAFVRGILFGIGGAIIGLVVYAAFGIITGLMLGYISLAVGYIVGKAIMMGSKGIGGQRYQIVAVLLTYIAVSMAAVPIGISQILKHRDQLKHSTVQTAPESPSASSSGDPSSDSAATNPNARVQQFSVTKFIGSLLYVGLASPFLELSDPFHGIIGLIILFVGIRIAWKLTESKQVDILGPFGEAVPAVPTA
jgi:hypothetical protein